MKTFAALALVAVAIAAVAAVPHPIPTKMQQAKSLQLNSNRNVKTLDPEELNKAAFNAYKFLQMSMEEFLVFTSEQVYESPRAYGMIVDIFYNVTQFTTGHYNHFRDEILSGSVDEIQIMALVTEVVDLGKKETNAAVDEVFELTEYLVPDVLDIVKPHGIFTVNAIKYHLEQVLYLLYTPHN